MARLPKRKLIEVTADAVRESGLNALLLSRPTEHPALFNVYSDQQSTRVRVYIWNITPGGTNRAPDEYRIQVTDVSQFKREQRAKTRFLGYWEALGIFAGWDIRQHAGS